MNGHALEHVAAIDVLVIATNGPTATGRGRVFVGTSFTGASLLLQLFAVNVALPRAGTGATGV